MSKLKSQAAKEQKEARDNYSRYSRARARERFTSLHTFRTRCCVRKMRIFIFPNKRHAFFLYLDASAVVLKKVIKTSCRVPWVRSAYSTKEMLAGVRFLSARHSQSAERRRRRPTSSKKVQRET